MTLILWGIVGAILGFFVWVATTAVGLGRKIKSVRNDPDFQKSIERRRAEEERQRKWRDRRDEP